MQKSGRASALPAGVTGTGAAGAPGSATAFPPLYSLLLQGTRKSAQRGRGLGDPAQPRAAAVFPPAHSHGYSSPWSCFFYLCSTFAYLKSKTRSPSAGRAQNMPEEPNRKFYFLLKQALPFTSHLPTTASTGAASARRMAHRQPGRTCWGLTLALPRLEGTSPPSEPCTPFWGNS